MRGGSLDREFRRETHASRLTVPRRVNSEGRDGPTRADRGHRHEIARVGLRAVHAERVDLPLIADGLRAVPADAVQPEFNAALTEPACLALNADKGAILVVDDQVVWIRVEEALRRSGVSRATLYRLISSGQVTRAKRAGDARAYVKTSDLDRALKLRPTAPRPRRTSESP